MKIGVTGASGQLGTLVIAQLKSRIGSGQIIPLARSPEKLVDPALVARAFDYEDKDSLAEGLEGVDTLVMISSVGAGKRVAHHSNVIAAATAAGVGHIVYTGVLHTVTSSWALVEDHKIAEAELKNSGVPSTIMRHSIYSEAFVPRIAEAVTRGLFIGSAGTGRTASASRADLAEALAIVATASAGEGYRIHELAGDDAWTMEELAAETSRQTGRQIPYNDLSTEDHIAALVSQGLPEVRARMIAGLDTAMRSGAVFDQSHALSKLLGRPTASLGDLVSQGVKAAA